MSPVLHASYTTITSFIQHVVVVVVVVVVYFILYNFSSSIQCIEPQKTKLEATGPKSSIITTSGWGHLEGPTKGGGSQANFHTPLPTESGHQGEGGCQSKLKRQSSMHEVNCTILLVILW